jgi:hypothetical protein
MRPGQDTVERIRRHEVSRALKKVNVSSEEAGIIDLLSRSLVGKLLDGPISEVLARAVVEIPFASRPGPEGASRGLEGNGGGAESSGPETPNSIRGNGAYYIELEIGSDGFFSKPARSNGETGGTGDRSISVT